jgi:single-stranded DNA-binding protein
MVLVNKYFHITYYLLVRAFENKDIVLLAFTINVNPRVDYQIGQITETEYTNCQLISG